MSIGIQGILGILHARRRAGYRLNETLKLNICIILCIQPLSFQLSTEI